MATREELLARVEGLTRARSWSNAFGRARTSDDHLSDLDRLRIWREIASIAAVDIGEMLGGSLQLAPLAGEPIRCCGAIALTLIAEHVELDFAVGLPASRTEQFAREVLGGSACADAIRDALREIANVAGGAIKRAGIAEGVAMTIGIPTNENIFAAPRVRTWALSASSGLELALGTSAIEARAQAVRCCELREGMEHVVVTGGLAGDGARFARTWVVAGARPETTAAVAVGLFGDQLRVMHGSQGGWDAFGPERCVTLDGRPALELYTACLGDRAADLPSSALLFPLSLRDSTDATNSVVRTVLSVDEATQSMTFAGDIPTWHYAKPMRANFDRLILGARRAGELAVGEHAGPALSIAVSCVGRRLVLGERVEEETKAALEALPPGTTQVGFYSYGELSPHADGPCHLHNETMTLTVFSETA